MNQQYYTLFSLPALQSANPFWAPPRRVYPGDTAPPPLAEAPQGSQFFSYLVRLRSRAPMEVEAGGASWTTLAAHEKD